MEAAVKLLVARLPSSACIRLKCACDACLVGYDGRDGVLWKAFARDSPQDCCVEHGQVGSGAKARVHAHAQCQADVCALCLHVEDLDAHTEVLESHHSGLKRREGLGEQ
jgi:hypothetical protein